MEILLATVWDVATPLPHAPLPELLRRIGLASWEDTPAASATRLARSGRYWLSLRDDDLTPEKYDRLVTLEAVLNLYADLRPDGASRDGGQALDHRLHDVLASTAELMASVEKWKATWVFHLPSGQTEVASAIRRLVRSQS